MKEQDLIDLGLEKIEYSEEDSPNDVYYFYEGSFANDSVVLTSNINTNAENGEWTLILDIYDYALTDFETAQKLLELLK